MPDFPEHSERRYQYQSHLKHLKLKGLQPKTIDAYARGMRRIGEYFSYQVDALSEDRLTDYFTLPAPRSPGPAAAPACGAGAGHLLPRLLFKQQSAERPKSFVRPDVNSPKQCGRPVRTFTHLAVCACRASASNGASRAATPRVKETKRICNIDIFSRAINGRKG